MKIQRYKALDGVGLDGGGEFVLYADVAEYVKAVREECADICDLYHFADSAAIEIRALNKD